VQLAPFNCGSNLLGHDSATFLLVEAIGITVPSTMDGEGISAHLVVIDDPSDE
jgi:hypothetical protein